MHRSGILVPRGCERMSLYLFFPANAGLDNGKPIRETAYAVTIHVSGTEISA